MFQKGNTEAAEQVSELDETIRKQKLELVAQKWTQRLLESFDEEDDEVEEEDDEEEN